MQLLTEQIYETEQRTPHPSPASSLVADMLLHVVPLVHLVCLRVGDIRQSLRMLLRLPVPFQIRHLWFLPPLEFPAHGISSMKREYRRN